MTLERVYSAVTKDKQIPCSMFMGKPSLEMSFIRLSFSLDGTVKVQNEWNDEFTINPPTFGFTSTIELYQDTIEETIGYRLTFQYKGKDYEIWIYFKFKAELYTVKIAITGTLPSSGQIKIPFSSLKNKVMGNKCVWFGTSSVNIREQSFGILTGVCFNWEDVATGMFDDAKNEVAFNVNSTFTIDPTVGTSTYANPVIWGKQKKCFYLNGRWWAWYYNGTSFGWETSTDGVDWSGSFTNFYADYPHRFDIWVDETNTKICVARCGGSNSSVYYRQGTANSDGIITWDSAAVVVCTDAETYGVRVCKDSNGYPWISYLATSSYYHRVVKATATDGSSWGTPTTLWTNRASGAEEPLIVSLTGGKMMCLSFANNVVVQSRLYDGSSWASAVNASSSNCYYYQYCDAVADGDNVHIVFLKPTSYDIIYVKYTYGTGWGGEETVEASGTNQFHPAMTLKDTDKVRVFYISTTTTVKYRDRDSGSWQTAVTISSSEMSVTCLSSSYKAVSNNICVMWKSGSSSPYNVKIQTYTLAGGVTYEIYVDAVTKTLAVHAEECAFNIAKDAAVTSQAERASETTFNISKDAMVQTFSIHSEEAVYNILKDAVTQVLATVLFEVGVFKEAIVQASAAHALQVMFTIPKDTIVQALSTPSLQIAFNLSPEAVVRVIAEVSVVKEGEVKVTRLFLMLGNLAIQIQGD